MSRLVDQPIEVFGVPSEDGQHGDIPTSFAWRGQCFRVRELLDTWPDAGAWWDGERESTFFRITVDEGTVFELLRDNQGRWRVYRIYD